MNYYGISNILTFVISLFLAIFVYVKSRNARLARIWSLFALSAAFYGFGAYMVSVSTSQAMALFWWRIGYIGIVPLPFFFVCVVYEFLDIRRPLLLKLMGISTVVYLILNLFFVHRLIPHLTLYFSDIKWAKPLYFAYPPGPLLAFFILVNFFGFVIYGHIELIRQYSKISGIRRNQARYFFFAATLGFFGGGASFLLCFGISFYPILNFAVPLYFMITAYAILRYRLMDIKIVITRTGIFIIIYTLVLGLPFAVAAWLEKQLLVEFGDNWWMLPIGLMGILATVGPFMYIYLQRKAEERILKEQKRYQEVLRQTGAEMTRMINLQKLLDLIVEIITENVHISRALIYVHNKVSGKFLLKASGSLKRNEPAAIEESNPVIAWLKEKKVPLVYEEIKEKATDNPQQQLNDLKDRMQDLRAAVIVPSFLEAKLSNLLILGDKLSGEIYTSEDLGVFLILANQMAIGIENAILYGNMEEQVNQRTSELLETQKQLVHAEKLATIGTLAGGVAHEINNPLTAILTNVQMLLAFSQLEEKSDRESLQLIEEATRRCRSIVQKLMTFAKKPLENAETTRVNLLQVVNNVAALIGYQLKQENIEIVIEAKKSDYPVRGNQNELEQVVTNIVLNAKDAIRQIKKGGNIYVSLVNEQDSLQIKIRDEGAGISKQIIPKIFDPFFTTKEVGKGVGLGLSICQSIVEKHQGAISVDSQPGKGSTFTIRLPKAG